MKLSTFHKIDIKQEAKAKILEISNDLKAFGTKNLNEDQKKHISDALAIVTSISANIDNLDNEQIKSSMGRCAKLITAAFNEDIAPTGLRDEIRTTQMEFLKDVEPRSIGEGKTLLSNYPENNGFNKQEKTRSAIDPSRIAEMILRDLSHVYYYNAQDAYDGYCSPNGAFGYASAYQKCQLGKLLQAYNFAIKFDSFEKEAQKDKEEYIKAQEAKKKTLEEAKDLGKMAHVKGQAEDMVSGQTGTTGYSRTDKGLHEFDGQNYPCWVCAYMKDLAYGGPEEGGWWYTSYDLLDAVQVKSADEAKTKVEEFWQKYEMHNDEQPSSNVNSGGKVLVITENNKGERAEGGKPAYSSKKAKVIESKLILSSFQKRQASGVTNTYCSCGGQGTSGGTTKHNIKEGDNGTTLTCTKCGSVKQLTKKKAQTAEDHINTSDAKKQEGDWQVSQSEPDWQMGRLGKEYQCVWQPSTGRRGFLGRDDIIYFDPELTQVMPTYKSAGIGGLTDVYTPESAPDFSPTLLDRIADGVKSAWEKTREPLKQDQVVEIANQFDSSAGKDPGTLMSFLQSHLGQGIVESIGETPDYKDKKEDTLSNWTANKKQAQIDNIKQYEMNLPLVEREFNSKDWNQMYIDLRNSGDDHATAMDTIRGERLMKMRFPKKQANLMCQGCGYAMGEMVKTGDAYSDCPKCGNKMVAANVTENEPLSKMPNNLQNDSSANTIDRFLNQEHQSTQNSLIAIRTAAINPTGWDFRLVKKSETGEWVVKAYFNGKYDEESTYYTDDKEDAIDTMKTMIEHAKLFPTQEEKYPHDSKMKSMEGLPLIKGPEAQLDFANKVMNSPKD